MFLPTPLTPAEPVSPAPPLPVLPDAVPVLDELEDPVVPLTLNEWLWLPALLV